MTLLVDIGNTRLKWRWLNGPTGEPLDGVSLDGVPLDGVLPLAEANAETLAEQFVAGWGSQPEPCEALLSCVADEQAATLALQAAQALGLHTRRVRTTAQAAGVRNGYAQPELLGVDRWLCLLAAQAQQRGAACIVGVGTALTVDLLDANGQHHGGLLVPGPALMTEALMGGTARIGAAARVAEPQVREGLGVNTAGALQEGAWLAAAALADRATQDFAARTGAPVWLCLTGGGAAEVAQRVRQAAAAQAGMAAVEVQPDLVLQGLARVARGLVQGEADCGMMAPCVFGSTC